MVHILLHLSYFFLKELLELDMKYKSMVKTIILRLFETVFLICDCCLNVPDVYEIRILILFLIYINM